MFETKSLPRQELKVSWPNRSCLILHVHSRAKMSLFLSINFCQWTVAHPHPPTFYSTLRRCHSRESGNLVAQHGIKQRRIECLGLTIQNPRPTPRRWQAFSVVKCFPEKGVKGGESGHEGIPIEIWVNLIEAPGNMRCDSAIYRISNTYKAYQSGKLPQMWRRTSITGISICALKF
jgi:hypothetical protein